MVNGTSSPKDLARPTSHVKIPILDSTREGKVGQGFGIRIPIARAVLPVPGGPAIKTARPAILPSLIICMINPADLRALSWPTMPWEAKRGWRVSSRPRPAMWVCMPMRLTWRPRSRDSVVTFYGVSSCSRWTGCMKTVPLSVSESVRCAACNMDGKREEDAGRKRGCELQRFSPLGSSMAGV